MVKITTKSSKKPISSADIAAHSVSRRKISKRAPVIVILILIVLASFAYIVVDKIIDNKEEQERELQQEKQEIYIQGAQYGQLLEQRNAILSIQQNGYYAIPVFDENNQSTTIMLGLIQQPQQQAPQQETPPLEIE